MARAIRRSSDFLSDNLFCPSKQTSTENIGRTLDKNICLGERSIILNSIMVVVLEKKNVLKTVVIQGGK